MSKNIIILSDGTGNQGGQGNGTNVWRLYNAIDLHGHETDADMVPQIAAHDDGVGTDDFKLFKQIGGITGWGLSRNIRQLYEYLVLNYEPGDRIFLFGFSRGAFTVRSLSGLITCCGIIDRKKLGGGRPTPSDIEAAVKKAFKAYRKDHRRSRGPTQKLRSLFGMKALPIDFGSRFKQGNCHAEEEIECIGVWDTVGAVGVPFAWLRKLIDFFFTIDFHKHDVSPIVRHGYHALAIDDERLTFHPTLWNEQATPGIDAGTQEVEQVWFAGAHSNVGGGYPKQGLAHVTLYWMMKKIGALGIRFKAGAVEDVRHAANVHDRLYDPRSGVAAFYRYLPRDIQAMSEARVRGLPKIHRSVFDRIEVATGGYSPGNIPSRFELVDSDPQAATRDPETIVKLAQDALAHPNASSPLDLTRKHDRTRVYMQYVYTTLAVLLLYGTMHAKSPDAYVITNWLGQAIQGVWSFITALIPWQWLETQLNGLGCYLAYHPWRALGLVAIAVGFPFISGTIKQRADAVYTRAWGRFRAQIRQVRRTQSMEMMRAASGTTLEESERPGEADAGQGA